MTRVKTYLLDCDADGCSTRFVPIRPTPDNLTRVRAQASGEGWRHVLIAVRSGVAPSLDFCPSCVTIGLAVSQTERVRAGLGDRAGGS